MAIKIALAGNPNSGKTTMFNDLTGSNQYVGNWPGVTVEKKEGRLKGAEGVIVQDLPGIYSLSPYTLEEVVARSYLVNEKPDAILNIVDATNIERNLYLTTQLAELGIPMVVALNMIDVTRRNGDAIDLKKLGDALGCEVVETSALKGVGSREVAGKAAQLARKGAHREPPHVFAGSVEHALAHIEDLITHRDGQEEAHHHHADGSVHEGHIVEPNLSRWYAIKLFERDEKVVAQLNLPAGIRAAIEEAIRECEIEMDDDAESIITNQRYAYISRLVSTSVKKGRPKGALTASDRIDRVLTNRVLGLPIFALIMFLVYYISVTTIGTIVTDFTNDTFVGAWIQAPVVGWLEGLGVAGWLVGLIGDGIIGGVGGVVVFLPNILLLFFAIAILEDSGYMARAAFIMDRLMHRIGLHGKSFIPMLIGFGCSVPAIMATRMLENRRDRLVTMLVVPLMSCGARLPIYALIIPAFFPQAWNAPMLWIIYVIGILLAVISAKVLRGTIFKGESVPFVMELPPYRLPTVRGVLTHMWQRGWLYLKKAGTIILGISILLWALTTFPGLPQEQAERFEKEKQAVEATITDEEKKKEKITSIENAMTEASLKGSIAGRIGHALEPVLKPMGFDWKIGTALIGAFAAKEVFVAQLGIVYSVGKEANEESSELRDQLRANYTPLVAFCIMLFCLVSAPCMATIAVTRRESNSWKWALFQLAGLTVMAWILTVIVFQAGRVLGIGI